MGYRLITFDVYTALFDIETSLAPVVDRHLKVSSGLSFVREWRRKQLEFALIGNSLQKERIPFSELTDRALKDTLVRANLSATESVKRKLLDAWLELQPWPEASSVLTALHRKGHTLGLLSNGDADQLKVLATRLPPVFTHIFSSEEAGFYKPHPAVYALPMEGLHLKADEILHVAGSPVDALGTKAAGLHCAWSNRQNQPVPDPRYPPDYEMSNLSQLPEILENPFNEP